MSKYIKLKVRCLRCGEEFSSVCDSKVYSYYKYLKLYKIDCTFNGFDHACTKGKPNSSSILILEENEVEE